jgi:KipI family sensor histidine kinase inhibitor
MVVLGDRVDRSVHRRVLALARRLEASAPAGVREIVPAYTTVTVFFSPDADAEALRIRLEAMARAATAEPDPPDPGSGLPPVVIPTRYEGPDLEWVAERTGLSPAEVIRVHAGREYEVFLLGFAPGFAYLGELDPRLRLPRRHTPRIRVPAGSVAIAGDQTAVYPLATPGGWHLIGHTDLVLFDPARDPPALLAPGRRVRFAPIP